MSRGPVGAGSAAAGPGTSVRRTTRLAGPSLATAVDGRAMRDVFQRHLAASAQEVIDCRVVRYRDRPDDRRLVQYSLTVRDSRGASSEARVTGQWHADPDHAPRLATTLAKRAAAMPVPWQGPFGPVFFDEDTRMLATTYPFDRRLTALPLVASGTAPELLAPMLGWMGARADALESVGVDTMRYREQLNAVVRYEVRLRERAGAAPARFYVKSYADDGGARAAATLAVVASATSGTLDAAQVQRPVAYVDRLHALVLAEAPGLPLDHTPLTKDAVIALERTGETLAAFGRLQAPLPTADTHALRVTACDRACRAVAEAAPTLSPALDRLWRAVSLPAPHVVGLVHGDLKLEHVFVEGMRVTLIDLDSCHLGDPLWDLALLEARWWAARDAVIAERPWCDRGRQALRSGYFGQPSCASRRGLPRLRALACLDVAAGIVKRREAHAVARAARLVAEAARALEGPS